MRTHTGVPIVYSWNAYWWTVRGRVVLTKRQLHDRCLGGRARQGRRMFHAAQRRQRRGQ